MHKDSKESPIVSFRVPFEVIEKLISKGVLKKGYNKSDLIKVAKDELFRAADEDIMAPIKVNDVYEKIDSMCSELSKIDEVLAILREKPQVA